MNCALGGGLTSFRVGLAQPSGGVGRGKAFFPSTEKNKQIHVSKGESGPCCCLALQMRGKDVFLATGEACLLVLAQHRKMRASPFTPSNKKRLPYPLSILFHWRNE